MPAPSLFDPYQLGDQSLSSRIVMAPMTRSRAESDWSPSRFAATYYGQRSSAGLAIAEATQVGPDATGYPRTPGIWTTAHAGVWAEIVNKIQAGGAKAYIQLWHCGRIAHPDNMPKDCFPIAPSAVRPQLPIFTDVANALVDNPMPREMTEADIARVIDDHRNAAEHAKRAGFDGVELHGANGYLIEQFASSNTNLRQDSWGGTLAKRLRFMTAVLDAVADVFPRSRIGIRLSPFGTFNEIADATPAETYAAKLEILDRSGIGYVHIIRPRVSGDEDRTASETDARVIVTARKLFSRTIIAAGGYTEATAVAELAAGKADLIAFGRPFIANPDFPRRLRDKLPLASFNAALLYEPGAAGYVDYPTHE
jgi:N-ethylmaleimide reductase